MYDDFSMKKNLSLMYAISFLQGMVFYYSIATLYRQAAGMNMLQIAGIESVSLALSLILELPWGVLADRIGYRRTMLICCGLWFVSKIVFWRAAGFYAFLLERVLLAVVISGISGVDSSVLFLSCEDGESQKAFGLYQSFGTAGLLAAAAVYTLFIGENYRLAALLTVFSYGLAFLLSFGLTEVRPKEQTERPSLARTLAVLKETLMNRRLLLLVCALALVGQVHQTITVFLNQLQYTRAGLPVRWIAAVSILTTVAGLAGAASEKLTKKWRPRRFGGWMFALCALACLLLAWTSDAILSVIGVQMIALCFALLSPLGAELENRAVTTTDRATALSMNTLLADGLAVFSNLAFGSLADTSLSAAMLFGCGLCVAGMVLFLRAVK